jgi:2'-5' RNA ligase
VRVFAAIVPPDDLKQKLSRLLEVNTASARKSPVDQLHLTLLFYADLNEKSLPELASSIRGVCAQTKPFEVSFSALSFFPSPARPRVCVLQIRDGRDPLAAFRDRLAGSCPAGFDGRPFSPHLTLARIREGGKSGDCVFRGTERFAFTAKSCIVYESCPGKGGFDHKIRFLQEFL